MFNISFDPFSFITAIAAIWLAWEAFKRSHGASVALISCTFQKEELQGDEILGLKVQLRNDGIPLHRISASFHWQNAEGWRNISLPMVPRVEIGENSVFQTGMIAEFVLKSHTVYADLLAEIADPVKQNAYFAIKIQDGFEATRIPVGNHFDEWKIWWNKIAWDWKYKLAYTRGTDTLGKPVLGFPAWIPVFEPALETVTEFLQSEREFTKIAATAIVVPLDPPPETK